MDDVLSPPTSNEPIVASGPMSREVAHWYMDLTDGQFQAYQHANGQWYLYLARLQDNPHRGEVHPADHRACPDEVCG